MIRARDSKICIFSNRIWHAFYAITLNLSMKTTKKTRSMLNDWFNVKTIQNIYYTVCTLLRFANCALSHSIKCKIVNSLASYWLCKNGLWIIVAGCYVQLNNQRTNLKTNAVVVASAATVVFIWLPSGKRIHHSLWLKHRQTNGNGFFINFIASTYFAQNLLYI